MCFTPKTTLKLQVVQIAAVHTVIGTPLFTCVIPLLCEMHWLPISFLVQFKRVVITFKVLYGIGPGYWWDHLSLKTFNWPTSSNNVCTLLILSPKYCHLMGARHWVFSMAAPALGHTLPSKVWQASSFVTFCKALKTWLFPKPWGSG